MIFKNKQPLGSHLLKQPLAQAATWQPLAAATWGKCLRVAASGCLSTGLLEHVAGKWLQVAALASGCKWLPEQVAASGCKWLFEQVTIRLNEWQFSFVLVLGLKILLIMSPPGVIDSPGLCDIDLAKTYRRKRYRRAKMIKITTPSQRGASFCNRNLSKKRSVYFWNDNPSITSASKGQPQLFLTFSSTCQRFFPGNATDVIIPPHPTPDYRMWMCGNANEDHRA